jgi:hypothetical protein
VCCIFLFFATNTISSGQLARALQDNDLNQLWQYVIVLDIFELLGLETK